jgi:hypothetical protein
MHADGRGTGRGDGRARRLGGTRTIGTLFGDAAQSAQSYKAALDAAAAQMPPELRAYLPDVPVEEFAGYALDADSFLAHPAEAATSIAKSYLTSAVGEEVGTLITEALQAAFATAGAAFGTMIPLPVIGTAIGAVAGKLVGQVVSEFENHNHDAFLAPDGSLIPEVEDVIAQWARPEYAQRGGARIVSEDFHNMGLYEGKGPFLTVLGRAGMPVPGLHVAWEKGIQEWGKPERLNPPDNAGKRFYDAIGYAMLLWHQRAAQSATAKAALVTRALQITKNPSLARLASGVNRIAFSVTQAGPLGGVSSMLNAATIQAATMSGPGLGALVLNRNAYAATLPAPVVVAGGAGLLGLVWWLWRFL